MKIAFAVMAITFPCAAAIDCLTLRLSDEVEDPPQSSAEIYAMKA